LNHDIRLARARQSLQGLSVGDAFGQRFFLPENVAVSMVERRAVPAPPWFFTDDTVMAISIVSSLAKYSKIDQDFLAADFATRYDPARAYGGSMHGYLVKIRSNPGSWRVEAPAVFDGQGSFGNGSAMRIAPLGAYFADDLDTLIEQAKLSAVTTHCHPEAIAGAIATALAAGLAWQYSNSKQRPALNEWLERLYQMTPTSEVRRGIQKALSLSDDTPAVSAAKVLGNGIRVSAPDTVPFCLWAAGRYLDNYEEALWQTVSAFGDRDTTCAIVGGIVSMYTGVDAIPQEWLSCAEELPDIS
jgi:ADP-ribosylglycohydrolase